MPTRLIFIWGIFFLFQFKSQKIPQNNFYGNQIYYSAPTFNIKNTNITLGGTSRVGRFTNTSLQTIAETITAVCQAILINEKSSNIAIDGIINIAFQDYFEFSSSGQDASMSLVSNNLYYRQNNSKLNQVMNLDIAGLLSDTDFGTAKINSFLSNDLRIPFVCSGDLARNDPNNQFSGSFPAEKYGFAQILTTYKYTALEAVLSVLNHFNWTLVGNLYESNSYGYTRQAKVLDYNSKNDSPIFACNVIFDLRIESDNPTKFKKEIEVYCRCITSKNTINVIILWMSTTTAYSAIKALKNTCSAAKKWTFFITDDFQSPVDYAPDADIFQYSLLIRLNGPWNYQKFLEDCQEKAPANYKPTLVSLVGQYYEVAYNCKFKPALNESLQECIDKKWDRKGDNETCVCSINETFLDPYSVRSYRGFIVEFIIVCF